MTDPVEGGARPRVVFDTNVLASAAILPFSVSGQALARAVEMAQLCLSTLLLEEIVDVLHRPRISRYFEGGTLHDFLMMLARVSEMVEPEETIRACRDASDDKLLELAVAAGAHFLVSGDSDLQVLNPFRGIEIVSPREWLERHAEPR